MVSDLERGAKLTKLTKHCSPAGRARLATDDQIIKTLLSDFSQS